MEITLAGLSHRTASIDLRERLCFRAEEAAQAVREIKKLPGVEEALLLSTCNRTEIVLAGAPGLAAGHIFSDFFCANRPVRPEELSPAFYRYRSSEAVRHLFRVAGSLDSLVVGEPQILGQVKDAYHLACEAGGCGPVLNRLFHRTFQVAKRIRTETKIAEAAVSVSYAGVELARKIFGKLAGKEALLVGAGEMAELAAQHLLAAGVTRMTIANRTPERAAQIASQFGGFAVGWDRIDAELERADIVICSAAAPRPILGRGRMEAVIRARKFRPLFFVDLAMPRNVEPSVGSLEGCYVYDLDGLESVTDENRKARHAEAEKAEAIVIEETEEFLALLNSLQVVPTIIALNQQAEDIRRSELEKALADLKDLTGDHRERIDYLTSAIVKKILHTPITALKSAERSGNGEEITRAAKTLFGIEEEAIPYLQALEAVEKKRKA